MKTTRFISLILGAAALLSPGAAAHAAKIDGRIELAAKQSYVFRTYLKDDNIGVKSKDGAVTLTGSVSADSHKALAKDTVSGLPGVRSVENLLEVTGAPTANSDAWLSDKLKITLLFHRSVSVGKAEVEVKDGIVTLRGQADSQRQKDLTAACVRDVDGVTEVRNEMTVSEDAETKPRSAGEKIDDASISAQVKLALLLHRSTSVLNTSVTTKRGVVLVEGRARNAAERDLVTGLVNDITGVKAVKNRMTIE